MARAPNTTSSSRTRDSNRRASPEEEQARRSPSARPRWAISFISAACPGTSWRVCRVSSSSAPRAAPQTVVEADVSREPTDLPAPITRREPQTVRVDLLAVEVEGRLAEGSTYVRLLDVQRQGSRTVHPRAGRRHRRHSPEEFRRQRDDALGRFPCHDPTLAAAPPRFRSNRGTRNQ